jgi:hypothetical protein
MKKFAVIQLVLTLLIGAYSCSEEQVLKVGSPESVNMSSERLARIDDMIQLAVDSNWIAGAVGFIARDGKIVYD